MADAPNMKRIEELAAQRIADAVLATWKIPDADKMAARIVRSYVHQLSAEVGPETQKTYSQRIVEAAAAQLVRDQKAEAAQEERTKMLRAIRSPTAPHILEELRGLAESERGGKVKGARIPLLNKAYQQYGSYTLVLHAVEAV